MSSFLDSEDVLLGGHLLPRDFIFPFKKPHTYLRMPNPWIQKGPLCVCYIVVSCLKLLGWGSKTAVWLCSRSSTARKREPFQLRYFASPKIGIFWDWEYFLASCGFHSISSMTSVIWNEAVRDQLALLRCETSVNSAGNVGDVIFYQIISL